MQTKEKILIALPLALLFLFSVSDPAFAKRKNGKIKCPAVISSSGTYSSTSGALCFTSASKARKFGLVEGKVCLGSDCPSPGNTFSLSGSDGGVLCDYNYTYSAPFTITKSAKVTYSNTTSGDCSTNLTVEVCNTSDTDGCNTVLTLIDSQGSNSDRVTRINKTGTYFLRVGSKRNSSWSLKVDAD